MWTFASREGVEALTPETVLALTLGDPRGIGPEVAVRAAKQFKEEDPDTRLLLIGPENMAPGGFDYCASDPWDGTQASAGAAAAAAIESAVELATAGQVAGIITGPVHKPALVEAGWHVPGHTEMLQQLTGSRRVGMLMCAEHTLLGPPLRVLLATTHVPLRDVAGLVTTELLVDQAELLAASLADAWDIPAPRLALCALNPHASDQGLFGHEEATVMEPAVEALRGRGVSAEGPIPADTVFSRALDGEFDAVVAPYHDVGMAPFKAVAFGHGVNVTLGLPFVRTSPDHGTAFDLAGTGTADPSSMVEAVRLAARLARKRFDTAIAHV
ncbi:MAG: 4-hydroxythreonine-4-phosphate dehydrogenase PdxA [Gemmatimonadota bacterium]|nr:MAG: 4-hydroxythreonine-4-phosphate dehydrogenase PdxA [Gemmatimonadota bacterium]